MKAMLSSLCTPAFIYLVLAVISLIVGLMYKFSIMTIVTKGFFVLLWTWILNFLCKKGFKTLAWIMVLLPFILLFFAMFFIVDTMMLKTM